jgi:hypothetical protein
MQMKLQFPADAPQILSEIKIAFDGGEQTLGISEYAVVTFTLHTPDGDFTYTIDNARKTLATESDSPFLA